MSHTKRFNIDEAAARERTRAIVAGLDRETLSLHRLTLETRQLPKPLPPPKPMTELLDFAIASVEAGRDVAALGAFKKIQERFPREFADLIRRLELIAEPVEQIVEQIPKETRGRKPIGDKPLSKNEQMRRYRARKKEAAGAVPPPNPALLEHDLIQDSHPDAVTAEQRWQWSLGNAAGDAVAMAAFWRREFGAWDKFSRPPELVTLALQAADAWQALVRELKGRRQNGKAS